MSTRSTTRVLCGVLGLFTLIFMLAADLSAQPPAPAVKLRWYGQSMFQLESTTGRKVVFDPHIIPEFGRNLLKADVVVCSHLHNDHTQLAAVEDAKSSRVFQGLEEVKKGRPPEWKKIDEKVGQIRVRTVGTYHDAEDGLARGKNSAFVLEVDGLTFCHLGDLGHELSAPQVKAIGPVDVLMIPVGGIYTLNGEQAKKVVNQLKPRLFVLPMHYGMPGYDELLPVDEFLDGQPRVKKSPDTNELVIPTDLKVEGYTTVVLGWRKEETPKK